MVKIKVKKEMDLVELIEWVKENKIKNKHYISKNHYIVTFDKVGFLQNSTSPLDEKFIVEVEEKITEDTVIPKILVKTNYDHTAKEYCNSKINQFLSQYYKAFYIVNDDLTMTLIWKNGKLVE